jgi:hypothetical protein
MNITDNNNLSIIIPITPITPITPIHKDYKDHRSRNKNDKYDEYDDFFECDECFEWKSVFYEVLDETQILYRVFEDVIELEVEIQNAIWNRFFGSKIEHYFINEKQNILCGLEVFESRMTNKKSSLEQLCLLKRNQKLISNVDDLLKNYFEEKEMWWA